MSCFKQHSQQPAVVGLRSRDEITAFGLVLVDGLNRQRSIPQTVLKIFVRRQVQIQLRSTGWHGQKYQGEPRSNQSLQDIPIPMAIRP